MSHARRTDQPQRSRKAASGILDRQPPHHLEAELGVLGSILLKPDVCDDIASTLRREDFYDEAHQLLFAHMQDMHTAGKRIDVTLLVNHLKKSGDFDKLGGAAFLARVSQAVPNAAHAKYYANIVREKAIYRSVIDASTQILEKGYEEAQEAKEFLNFAEQQMFAVMNNRAVSNVASINDVLIHAMERIDQRLRGTLSSDAVETGFADLDTLMGGLTQLGTDYPGGSSQHGKDRVRDEHCGKRGVESRRADVVRQFGNVFLGVGRSAPLLGRPD